MRILLTNTISHERFNCPPDLGLGYLASLARNDGHEVRVLDCLLERCDLDGFERRLRDFRPDVVAMKAYSIDMPLAAAMLERAKAVDPDAVTILGGPHPSMEAPEELMRQAPALDYAVAGEGEPGFTRFLRAIDGNSAELEGVPGLIRRDGHGGVRANDRAFVEDLSSLPFPAWDLIDPRRYRCGYSFMTRWFPAAPMVITRGCPYACSFCSSYLLTGRTVRKRSLDNAIEEIRLLQRDYGVRSIDICDENFVFDNDFAAEFCERLIRENLRIRWNCPYGVRLDRLNEKLVRLMERAGCYGLSLGVESGSDRILEKMRKRITVAEIREQVLMIKRVSRMMLQAYFVLGYPGETRADVEASLALARSLPFDIVVFAPMRITPGTAVYEELVEQGVLEHRVDYAGYGHHYFVRSYCEVPDDEMRRLYRKGYLQFYRQPRVIWNLVKHVRSRAQVRTLANGLVRLLARPAIRFDPRRRPAAMT